MGIQMDICTCIFAFVTTQLLLFAAPAWIPIAPNIGVNYGTVADNLPAPTDVINLCKSNGIKFIRIYDPNPRILDALRGSHELLVTIGIKNEDITSIARNPNVAKAWVNNNIVAYNNNMTIIIVTVGNEVIPGPYAIHVAQAMRNIKSSLVSVGLNFIRVTTTMAFNLQTSYPPSAGAFAPDVAQIMVDVTRVLRETGSPLLVSIYPYFAYASNPKEISLEYATFTAQTPVMDGQLQYFNLLDAQIDAYYAALQKIGAGDITIAIAETGWPTSGNEPYTSVANAMAYNRNLITRVMSGRGTPRVPTMPLAVFIFSMFDEDLKPAGLEQHWGLFSLDMIPKYPLTFRGIKY